ncbi:hypothetical protein [Francisella persica]|nr:hypothetical protein [Francisella persica]
MKNAKVNTNVNIPNNVYYVTQNNKSKKQLSDYKIKDFAIALLIGDKNFNQSQDNLFSSET